MIITTELHGRRRSDSSALIRHLVKPENNLAYIGEIGRSVAETLPQLVAVMEVYRDASPAKPAFHHVTINPAADLSREKLLGAAHKVRFELDPSDTRPFAIVVHHKPRAEKGGAAKHAHLVLAHVDSKGKALDDRWIKVRTERVARELEFWLGEPALLGRHHRPVLRVLRATAPEIAMWLEASLGAEPPKPNSAFAPGARGRARKQGLDLPEAKAAVRAAWANSEGISEFRARLAEGGLELKAGDKPYVWIIQDREGRLVGAADRLLRMRRNHLNELMEMEAQFEATP
jgi:hypothetical protein